jgi:hypothetical protein
VNKLFEDHLKDLYSRWLIAHVLTPVWVIKKPSVELLCQAIMIMSVDPSTVNRFKNYCIPNEMDGREDEEEGRNVGSECEGHNRSSEQSMTGEAE